jgi:DnaJ like chaperone protein
MFFFPFYIGGGGFGGLIVLLLFLFIAGRVFSSLFRASRTHSSYVPGNREFFDGTFSMLAKIASADGSVSPGVKQKINRFMINDLRLDNYSYQYARSIFNAALSGGPSFETLADRFYVAFNGNPAIFQILMDMFYNVATDDGRISQREQDMLDYAARRFAIPAGIIEALRRKYGLSGAAGGSSTASSRAYAILGLTESATETEIKKAYRRLILEYHPDTVAQKGGPEFKEYATKKFVEIQQAYEEICKQRGIK